MLKSVSLVLYLFVVQVYCELSILNPSNLSKWWSANPSLTSASLANFGSVPWGKKLIGRLELANPLDACDFIKLKDRDYLEHYIFVTTRGNCTFVLKSHYAQLAGAKMLLVVDNIDEDVTKHIMIDKRGEGDSVRIPTALLSYQAGQKLIESLRSPDPDVSVINVIYDFELAKADHVLYRVWLSSSNGQSFKFAKEWSENEKKLAKFAQMEPHYFHLSSSDNTLNCMCGGRYCGIDPDAERSNTGADALMEDLRQICILRTFSKEAWQIYMNHYDSFCLMGGDMILCGNNILREIGIPINDIADCIKSSFDTKNPQTCTKNSIFEAEKSLIEKDNIYVFPSININGDAYRGSIFPIKGVFEGICEAFNEKPAICRQSDQSHPNHNQFGLGHLIIVMISFFVIFAFSVFCCYRRVMRREMNDQIKRDVSIIIEQYSVLHSETQEIAAHNY